MKKILIIFGGNSLEYDVSCRSAYTIVKNIDKYRYDVSILGIDRENNWYIFNDDISLLINGTWRDGNISLVSNVVDYLKQFDKVFPVMHGSPLENGFIIGMFELFDIKYVGSFLESSVICYDKILTKLILERENINMLPYQVTKKRIKKETLKIPFPVIVKPARCGSSIGINVANDYKELNRAIDEALLYDENVMIEKFIHKREFECAILDSKKLVVSSVGEIIPENNFYDYDQKYNLETSLIIPANIDSKLEKEIKDLSLKIFKILSLKDLARIDFLYDYYTHTLYFNEVNTMPGFTDISMYPKLFDSIGISLKNLITKLIEM